MSELLPRFGIALLVFAPLAFGATDVWGITIVELGAFFALLLASLAALRGGESLRQGPGVWPLLLLSLYVLAQCLPLPPAVLQWVSPAVSELYRQTVWLLDPGCWMSLSVNPAETFGQFLRLASYACFYLLMVQILSLRERRDAVFMVLAGFLGLYALIGIFQYLLPAEKALWILRTWPKVTPHRFGTYVNGNHYAGLMEMVLPLLLALFLINRPSVRYGSLRERILDFFDHPRSSPHVLLGCSALLVAASIFLSLSRGGILSTLISLLVFGVLLLSRAGERRRAGGLLAFVVAALLCVGAFGWDPILSRFEKIRTAQGEIADQRLDYWRDSGPLVGDYLWTGTGFGTYKDIYPYYQRVSTVPRIVDHAHNDYIELMTDAGVPGVLLALWFWGTVLARSLKAWRRRKGAGSTYLYFGGVCGLLAILFHSLTDFNLYIGANGLYFYFVAALIVSAATTRSGRSSGTTDLRSMPLSAVRLCTATALLLLVVTAAYRGGEWLAATRYEPLTTVDLGTVVDAQWPTMEGLARQALVSAPLSGFYHFAAGDIAFAQSKNEEARSHYRAALRLTPLFGSLLERVAYFEALNGKDQVADGLMQPGLRAFVAQPERGRAWTLRLLDTGRQEQALDWMGKVLPRDPGQTRDYLRLAMERGISLDSLALVVPPLSKAWTVYATELAKTEAQAADAEVAFRRALRFGRDEPEVSRSLYWESLKFFKKQEMEEDALEVLRQAIERFPAEAGFHAQAGSLYERRGISYRAIEEFRQALLLDPKQDWVKKRLEKLESKK